MTEFSCLKTWRKWVQILTAGNFSGCVLFLGLVEIILRVTLISRPTSDHWVWSSSFLEFQGRKAKATPPQTPWPEMLTMFSYRCTEKMITPMWTLVAHLLPFLLIWTQLATEPRSGSYNYLLSKVFDVQMSGPRDLRAHTLCTNVVMIINLKSNLILTSPCHPTHSHLTMQSAGIWLRKYQPYTSKNKAQLGSISLSKSHAINF